MELWQESPECISDEGDVRMVWERVGIVKVTAKRIYTEPYDDPQIWGYQEVRPWFDRQKLEQTGYADWSSRPTGGTRSFLRVYTDAGKAAEESTPGTSWRATI
jgi:hypothetical protein